MSRLALALLFCLISSIPVTASVADFDVWLRDVKKEALARGISTVTVEQALARITSYNVCYTKLLRVSFEGRSIIFKGLLVAPSAAAGTMSGISCEIGTFHNTCSG